VYGIVKQNAGHIWVYSEQGEGTTFKIYLPVSEKEKTPTAKEKSAPKVTTGTETILLAEDDESLRDVAKMMLEEHGGYRVLVAKNGNEALELLKEEEETVHLLITDVVMPGMDGKELAAQVQSIIPDIKTLFVSGYTNHVITEREVMPSEYHFIPKPFSLPVFLKKVREVLDEKE